MARISRQNLFRPNYIDRIPVKLNIQGEEVDCIAETAEGVGYMYFLVGTNGLKGGDGGHGSRCVFSLYASDGYSMQAKIGDMHGSGQGYGRFYHLPETMNEEPRQEDTCISIVFEGDCEVQDFADLLIRAGNRLKDQIVDKSE